MLRIFKLESQVNYVVGLMIHSGPAEHIRTVGICPRIDVGQEKFGKKTNVRPEKFV